MSKKLEHIELIPKDKLPSFEELQKHFKDNFHIEGNRLVPNESQPYIVDYMYYERL